MADMAYSSTPYDDVFRTLVNDCSKLIIPLINEAFGESYTGDEIIQFSPNEHFLNQQDGSEDKRITDTTFAIVGKVTKRYHLECQSTLDYSILIRIFEYDAQIALDQDSEIVGSRIIVSFPNTAVLFLRSNASTPDVMEIVIRTPGGDISYDVPVMKVKSYSIEEIFVCKFTVVLPCILKLLKIGIAFQLCRFRQLPQGRLHSLVDRRNSHIYGKARIRKFSLYAFCQTVQIVDFP